MTEPAVGYIYNFSYFCVHNISADHSFNEHNNHNSAYLQTLHCNDMKWNVLRAYCQYILAAYMNL